MQPLYTQFVARTCRPTQILGRLRGLDAFTFPHTRAGTVICERSSEALDVRIAHQVASGISRRGQGVLAIAGTSGTDFWCALYAGGGVPLFEHNLLTGPRDFQSMPVHVSQLEDLQEHFGADVSEEEVCLALTSSFYKSALERHEALAEALLLPAWSVGIGYSHIVEGRVPSEAGTPTKPPRCLADVRPLPEWVAGISASDSKEWFQQICQKAFGFLEEDFGFRRSPPQIAEPYMTSYRNQDLVIVIEGLSYGGRTRLGLIDQEGHLLDLSRLVERRNPELFDLCDLAASQREQIPTYAEALRTCAADVLAGDLQEIRPKKTFGSGFSL